MYKLKKHYLDYIQQHSDTAKLHIKWNWAAFFLGPLWLFYRSMFLYGFVYYLICIIFLIINSFLLPEYNINIIGLILHIFLGMYGTALFCNKCTKENLRSNIKENRPDREKVTIDNFICKTRPVIAVILCIILTTTYISVNMYVLYKLVLSQNFNSSSSIIKTQNSMNQTIKFNNFKLIINDKDIFYDPDFEEIKYQLKKVEFGKEKYAVLVNSKEQIMQMYLDREENGIKYYHIEYKLSPGNIFYITYDYKIPEEQMIGLFHKFYQNDMSFTTEIKWSPLNFKTNEVYNQ